VKGVNTTKSTHRVAVLGALAVTAIGLMRDGGYYSPDLLVIAGLLVAAVVADWTPISRSDRRVALALTAFAAGWLIRGATAETTARAVSLSAAAVAFGAAYLLARRCREPGERVLATRLLIFTAVGVALLSLVLWAADVEPWGLAFDGVWRLAGPFSYPNAAGLFFALASILNLARNERSWAERVICGATLGAALLATASRGGMLALGVGLVVLGRRQLHAQTPVREAVKSLATGAIAVGVLYVGLLTAGVVGGSAGSGSASIDDRVAEWSAAARQGGDNLLFGSGPELDLHIHNFRGDAIARFAHNEVLQVFAGLGVVGVALLAAVVVALVAAMRDSDGPRGRVAVASLAVFAVGGLIDFSWHFVGLTAFAGWLAGLDEDDPSTE